MTYAKMVSSTSEIEAARLVVGLMWLRTEKMCTCSVARATTMRTYSVARGKKCEHILGAWQAVRIYSVAFVKQ